MKKRPSRFQETNRKLGYLLLSLVLVLVIYPFLSEGVISLIVLDLIFAALLLISIYAVSYDRKHYLVGLCLGLPTLVINYVNFFLTSSV